MRPVSYPICLLAFTCLVRAHDIPTDARVQLFVKPTGHNLQVLVRVPLKSMRDIIFPEFGNGYLDTARLAPQLPDLAKLWIANFIQIDEGPNRLAPPRIAATQISLPSDRSFTSFESALNHALEPLPNNTENLIAAQVLFDVLLEYQLNDSAQVLSIRPNLQGLAAQVQTILRYQTPSGVIRAYEFHGDPGLVPLDPSWLQATLRFVKSGFLHILSGADHMLFLACLVIPFRQFRPLLWIVTAFTLAHSLTLLAATYNFLPSPAWIEAAIPATILYTALENIIGQVSSGRRWLTAFAFGLIHGFAFASGLKETLQFAGSHLLGSLLSFNLGVEFGQILVLLIFIPSLNLFIKRIVSERIATIILSTLIAHTAWHWLQHRLGF